MTPKEAYKQVTDMKVFARVQEVEDVLKTDADYAHRYAFHFLKAPWPEAEAVIKGDALVWDWYQVDTLRTKAATDRSLWK